MDFQQFVLSKPIDTQSAETTVKKAWVGKLGKSQELPIYIFERRQGVFRNSRIPPYTSADPNKNYIVACYQCEKRPYNLTIIGVCRGSKLNGHLKAGDMTLDIPEDKEENISMGLDNIETISLVIPDFFFFKGRPERLPEQLSQEQLQIDLDKFWKWLRNTPYTEQLSEIPKLSFSPDFLFFVLIMAVYNAPEDLVNTYSMYLEHQFKYAMPKANMRLLFAKRHGLLISGPEEVEQKLLATVRIEAGKLRDTESVWRGRVPAVLDELLDHVSNYWIKPIKRQKRH